MSPVRRAFSTLVTTISFAEPEPGQPGWTWLQFYCLALLVQVALNHVTFKHPDARSAKPLRMQVQVFKKIALQDLQSLFAPTDLQH